VIRRLVINQHRATVSSAVVPVHVQVVVPVHVQVVVPVHVQVVVPVVDIILVIEVISVVIANIPHIRTGVAASSTGITAGSGGAIVILEFNFDVICEREVRRQYHNHRGQNGQSFFLHDSSLAFRAFKYAIKL